MLRRVLQHINCISHHTITCGKGLHAVSAFSVPDGLLKVLGVTSLFVELEPCSLSRVAQQHQFSSSSRRDRSNGAHSASVECLDQSVSIPSCSFSAINALPLYPHHASTSFRSIPTEWDFTKRVSPPLTFRGFATLPKRAARKVAQRKGRPSSVVETDAQLPEQVSQSDSREITQTNVGKPSDVQIAAAVDHPALIITRDIEWGTVILGFEQANRYTVLDQDGNVVALMAEDMGSIGTAIGRQLLRTRRSFTATVFSPDGSQVIFRVRRPAYLINSTIIVEDGEGTPVGEVHQRWHLWKRKYDLYLERNQFASIEGNFLAWEFVLRNQDGGVLALIDRNFQGFGKELFTDAGKYVIHFGSKPAEAAEQAANTIAAAHPDKPPPKVTALARLRTDVQVVPTQTGNQLEVVRPLVLDERMTALAAAISIDYDYFSQHSHGPGMMPGFLFPMPIPTPSYPDPDAAPGADAGGIEAADAGAGPEAGPSPTAAGSGGAGGGGAAEPLDRDLGSDGFEAPKSGSDGGGPSPSTSWWDQDVDNDGGDGDGDGGSLWGDVSGFFSDD